MPTQGYAVGGVGNRGVQVGQRDPNLPSDPGVGKSLWQTAPVAVQSCEPVVAFEVFDDFIGVQAASSGNAQWITTQATSGTVAAGTVYGGTAALNSGATTQHQGIQMQRAGSHFSPTSGKHLWFECRLQVNHLYGEFLAGLFDVDTTLVATGALHATDGIGFKSLTSDGVVIAVVGASSTYTTVAAFTTLVVGTMVRLGFVVTSNSSVTFYLNGVATGAAVTTNIPSASLTPSFVSQAGSAAGANVQMDLDFVQVMQER